MSDLKSARVRIRLRAVASIVLLASSISAAGADADGGFSVHGAGLLTCRQFVKAREAHANAYYALAGWLNGYVTARNQFQSGTYDVLSFQSVPLLLAIIDQNCKANPTRSYFAVVNSLVGELAKSRIERSSPRVRVKVGTKVAVYYLEVIERMQDRLKRLGYYNQPRRAEFSEGLRKALADFQKDHGLPVDGFPDQPTLLTLFTDRSAGATHERQ